MYCMNCGTKNDENANYCCKCGMQNNTYVNNDLTNNFQNYIQQPNQYYQQPNQYYQQPNQYYPYYYKPMSAGGRIACGIIAGVLTFFIILFILGAPYIFN